MKGPFEFTVPGCPRPWKRASQARRGHKYTDPEMAAHQLKIQLAAKAAGVREWLTGDVALTVICYVPDRKVRDWDNLGKNVSDALNKVAYKDDAHVWDARVVKRLDPENPRTVVRLEVLR